MKRLLSLMLCVVFVAPGCAAAVAQQRHPPEGPDKTAAHSKLMADYIGQLPVGSKVKITLADGKVIRATLMRQDTDPIVVQRRTRLPEAPIEIPVSDILALELDTPSGSVGRSIAVGAGVAAGATLAVLALLAAIFGD